MDVFDEYIGYFVEDGVDLEDPDLAEYAADVMQAEQEAYFARKGAASKGKGFRQPPSRQFHVTGSLSLEERRAKVAALKARTTCRRCRARGNWGGDPTCPHTKGSGKKGKATSTSSALTSSGHSSRKGSSSGPDSKGSSRNSGKPRTIYFSVKENQAHDREANMAFRRRNGGGRGIQRSAAAGQVGRRQRHRGRRAQPRRPGALSLLSVDRGGPIFWTTSFGSTPVSRAHGAASWTSDSRGHRGRTSQGSAWRHGGRPPFRWCCASPGRTEPDLPQPASRHHDRPPRPSASTPTCAHARATRAGSNAHYKQKRCLDCGQLLEKRFHKNRHNGITTKPRLGCHHHRVSWKGTNESVWRRTCLDWLCTAGPVARGQPRMAAFEATSSTTTTNPDIYLTIDETEQALESFQCHCPDEDRSLWTSWRDTC